MPSVTPGQYRVIVRADIFNQIFEDQGDSNNITASADSLARNGQELVLGVPFDTMLSTGQTRLFQVTVPQDQTLRVTLSSSSNRAANEVFLRHNSATTASSMRVIKGAWKRYKLPSCPPRNRAFTTF